MGETSLFEPGDDSKRDPLALRLAGLEALARLTSRLIEASREDEILEAALDAIESAGTRRAAILLFDQAGVMQFRAWRGLSDAYRAAVTGHTPWRPGDRDAATLVVPDVAREASLASLLPLFRQEGIAGMAFVPLQSGGGVIGKFMLYYGSGRAIDEAELHLSGEIAKRVALGLERLRQAELIRTSRDELAAILEGVADGVTALAPDGRVIYANSAAARMVGARSVQDLLASPAADRVRQFQMKDADGRPFAVDRLPSRVALSRGLSSESLIGFVDRDDGSERWTITRSTPVFGDDGSVKYAINVLRDVTAARGTERALRDANDRLRGIVQASPLPIILFDAGSRIRLWNPAAAQVFGWSEEEALGQPIPDLAALQAREDVREALHLVRKGAGVQTVDLVQKRRDGSPLQLRAWVCRLGAGEPPEYLAVVLDRTDEKKREIAERLLAEAGRRLSQSLDWETTLGSIARLAVPAIADWCSISIADDQGVLQTLEVAHRDPERVRWAWDLQKRFPSRPDEPDGSYGVFRSGVPLLAREVSDELLQRAARDGEHLEALRSAGLRSAMIVPLPGRAQSFGVMSFVLAESGRNYGEQDLELATELGRRAGLAIENVRLYRREQEAREAAEGALGRLRLLQHITARLSEAATPEEVASVVLSEAAPAVGAEGGTLFLATGDRLVLVGSQGYDPHALERWQTIPFEANVPLALAFRERTIVTVESTDDILERYPDLRPSLSGAFRAFAAVPLLIEGKGIGGVAFSFAEPRTFSGGERELLAAVGAVASQALDRARLFAAEREARSEAEAANRAKDDFLATLSHELRTPMTATLGWARMLTMGLSDPDTLQLAADSIHRSVQAQTRLVDDLLDVSRIVTGKMQLDIRPVDLDTIVQNALRSIRPAAAAKSIALEFEVAGDPGLVAGDPDRLQQVLWNLLANAVKFTGQGGRIDVWLGRREQEVVIEVADTGQGIAPDLLPFVFERFRQGDSGASRQIQGLGLGLSIVKHLVEMHGGVVEARSEGAGRGATFTMRLPLAAEQSLPAESDAARSPFRPVLKGRRLLVVDDEPSTRVMLATVLQRFGGEVRTAASAVEALAVIDEFDPHLLVSDLAMPGTDGLALIARVRAHRDAVRLPAIALTALGRPEDRERSLAHGFQDFLAKPIEPDALLLAIQRTLDLPPV